MPQHTSRERRAWFAWHKDHGSNVSATCRHFAISRTTFYRWLKRYDEAQPQMLLRAKSRRPHAKRQPSWSLKDLAVLSHLAAEHPSWGRGRLQVALAARDFRVSSATVGRMLSAIKRKCPVCRNQGGEHHYSTHILHQQFTSKGLEMPLAATAPPRRRRRSRRKLEAIAEAQDIIRQASEGTDL